MRARFTSLAVLCLLLYSSTSAQTNSGFGLGIIVGEPTGISFKKWLNDQHAIDAAAAWSFSENQSFQFHMDYLSHNFSLLQSNEIKGRLPVYFGIGGRLKLKDTGSGRNSNEALLGVRIPVGISYIFPDSPLDLFLEIVPLLDLLPDTDFAMNAAIGVRYFFR